MTPTDGYSGRISRRALLRLTGGAGAAALLAACGGGAAPTATSSGAAPAATSTPSGGATTAAATAARATAAGGTTATRATGAATGAGGIVIRPSGAKLPTEKVTFRWIDSGDLKALFYKKYFAAYQQAHPNITIQYDALPWAEIEKIVPLGIQNGNAHDAFAVPPNFTGAQVVKEGWVAPLDEIIPNFADWKANFPPNSFIEGVHVFNGKTYTFPVTSDKRYATLNFYNVEYLQQAGYDLEAKPFTWDEFRAAAKKLTEQGKGQYYGLILGGKDTGAFATFVRNLARMAGAPAGSGTGASDINWKTGEYQFTSDAYLAVIDLLLGLKSDNSIFPGSLNLNAPQARAQVPQGAAAMMLEGPWNIPQWRRENANFKFGLASQPIPNRGAPIPLTFVETGANLQWVYVKSPHKAIAGDMFSYIASLEGQTAIVVATEGNLRAVLPRANQLAQESQQLDPIASKALKLFDEQIRLGPYHVIRNPQAAQVNLELKTVKPDFGEMVQGIFTGQLKDPKAAMKDLQDRSDKELDRAIKAAQEKGAKVSRDDWKFPNWDPTKDYTEADYKALKG